MAPFHAPLGAGELLPRYSFLEPLLEGRRVLEVGAVGSTDGGSAAFLAERGAAAVLSIDGDAGAVERAAAAVQSPFVQFRSVEPRELPQGAFDLVLVTDGDELVADPQRLAELHALLSADGFLVSAIAAPPGAGLPALAGEPLPAEVPSYESFVSMLAAEFPAVEVATQSAMVGYVIAAAPRPGEGEPEIVVDGSLAGAAEAAYYLAVCGERPAGLAGLTLVALPHRPLADAALANGEAARAHRGCLDASALAQEAEELRRAVDDRDGALAARETEIADALGRAAEREAQLGEKEARLAGLEVELEAARQRADAVERELEREREALFEARQELDRLRAGNHPRIREERERAVAVALEAEQAARAEAEASAQAARSEAQAARTAVQAALSRAESAEARAAELEQAAEELRREEAGRAAERERLREAEAELRGRASEASAELEGLRERAAAVERRAGEAEGKVAGLETRLAEAADRVAEAERRRADADESTRAADAAAAEVAAARSRAEAELGDLRGRLEAEAERAREAVRKAESAEARAAEAERLAGDLERLREVAGKLRAEVEEQGREKARADAQAAEARGAGEAAEAQAAALEAELQAVRWEKDEIEQRLKAAAEAGGGGEGAAALQKLAAERDALQAQLADRDGRIARLQREVADKTERLGRLAKEMGELKSKGLGKTFSP